MNPKRPTRAPQDFNIGHNEGNCNHAFVEDQAVQHTCASLRNVGQRLCCMSRCPEISRDVAESDAHQCISDLGGYIASHPRTYNHTVLLIILKFVRNICKLPKINTCHFNGPIEVQDLMQGGPHRYHFTSTRPTTRVTAIRTS